MSAAVEVERELETLYGSSQLCTAGVVHVVYAARSAEGRLCPLRIGGGVPRSPTDFFVLSLCRARADALLTSAENVRCEPRLSHRLQGRWAPALEAYRRETLGKQEPPSCAILTRSGDLPLQHPLWSDGTRKLLLTSPGRAATLAARFADRAQVVGVAQLSARGACDWLHARGAPLVSVETGPSSVAALYEAPPRVDELLLTVWEAAEAAPAMLAGPLPEDALLFAGLTLAGSSRREEGGHGFRFECWQRSTAGG